MTKNDSRGRVEHVDEHQAEGDKQHDSRRDDFLSPEMELMGKTGKKLVSCEDFVATTETNGHFLAWSI